MTDLQQDRSGTIPSRRGTPTTGRRRPVVRTRPVMAAVAALLLTGAVGGVLVRSATIAANAAPVPGKTWNGRATINSLGDVGLGNCSYPAEAYPDKLYTAAPLGEYDTAAGCGTSLDVVGPEGKRARVLLVDKCTECEPGHLDMSPESFAAVGRLAAGVQQISYTLAVDPVLPGPITVRVQSGSTGYWAGFLIMNHGNQLTSVEYRDSAGAWQPLTRTMYNFWHAESGAGPGPFTLRITDTNGHQVTVDDIALTPDVTQQTGVWMYRGGAPAPTGTAPAPSRGPSAPASAAPCAAEIRMAGSWPDGYQATLTARNDGPTTLKPWHVTWTVPDGVTVTGWNGTVTQEGARVSVVAPEWSEGLASGESVDIGFAAAGAPLPAPTVVQLNGMTCADVLE